MGWMAIGTGAAAPAFGNTALGAEIDRNALTSATDSANVVTYVGNWAAGDGTNAAITEAGIFNAASVGDDARPGDVHGDQQGRFGHARDHLDRHDRLRPLGGRSPTRADGGGGLLRGRQQQRGHGPLPATRPARKRALLVDCVAG